MAWWKSKGGHIDAMNDLLAKNRNVAVLGADALQGRFEEAAVWLSVLGVEEKALARAAQQNPAFFLHSAARMKKQFGGYVEWLAPYGVGANDIAAMMMEHPRLLTIAAEQCVAAQEKLYAWSAGLGTTNEAIAKSFMSRPDLLLVSGNALKENFEGYEMQLAGYGLGAPKMMDCFLYNSIAFTKGPAQLVPVIEMALALAESPHVDMEMQNKVHFRQDRLRFVLRKFRSQWLRPADLLLRLALVEIESPKVHPTKLFFDKPEVVEGFVVRNLGYKGKGRAIPELPYVSGVETGQLSNRLQEVQSEICRDVRTRACPDRPVRLAASLVRALNDGQGRPSDEDGKKRLLSRLIATRVVQGFRRG